MKNFKLAGVVTTLIVAAVAILNLGQSFAASTPTNTTLGIRTGVLNFYKDTGTSTANFGHVANVSTAIDIGTYDASVSAQNVQSSGDHRFTISDLLGKSFTVTLQSSDLTALDASGATMTIPKAGIGYTGTNRFGTGKALTATGNGGAADIGTAPVTFVARTNHSGVSVFSQEITLKVAIPAAQGPGSYTGLLTFTY
jgi:hypothetical protein